MASFLNISEAASIAIHSMAYIANAKELVSAQTIATQTAFSRNHLAKVLQILVKNNYLNSTRGPKGGFTLKKQADKINLLEIYELMEGVLKVDECQRDTGVCPFEDCVFGNIREELTDSAREYFRNRKLSDIKTVNTKQND